MTVTESAPPVPEAGDVEVLWERLARVEQRVRHAVAARRATDPEPDDPYRGQYLTPEAVERVLESRDAFAPVPPYGREETAYGADQLSRTTGRSADSSTPAPHPGSRLDRLARSFGLLPLDVELLLVAVAPDIDPRFERLYGYLNDDLTRRRPAIGLALELCGLPAAGSGRFRFQPSAPLVAGGLLEITDLERPLLSRALRVPDRVTAHLLGDDEPDGRLRGLVQVPAPADSVGDRPEARRIAAALATGSGLVHLLDRGGDPAGLAVEALGAVGRRPLVVDIAALAAAGERTDELAGALATEARLAHGGVVLGPLEALDPERPEGARLLAFLCTAVSGTPLIAYGKRNWDPLWTRDSPVPVAVPPPGPTGAARRWRQALADA
ncbi:ATP-binding protein, partial [Streptomyces rhizosphaericola]